MMRVLHVIASMDPQEGGVCQAVRSIVGGLAALGVHNEVVSLDAPDAAFFAHDSFATHGVGPAKGPWAYSPELIPWLTANFSRFDAVLVHGLWLYHGYATRTALRRHRAQAGAGPSPRLYIMPHGMLDPYFQRAPGRKLKAIRNYFYWKLLEGRVVNDADGLLFTCEQERLLAREPFRPYHPRHEAVVGLGVEPPPPFTSAMQAAFRERCPELGNDAYILFLSRIHEKKGVDLLLQAYAALVRRAEKPSGQQTETVPRLVVAGPGLDTAYGRSIQQLASSDARLSGRVSFPGMLSGNSKWGAFYGSEAFALPSHQENFGIAVVEALACGKPTLISNQVNIWREIETAGGGMVADDTLPGTQHVLERWLATSPAQKAAMGKQAQVAFQANFATAPAARRLLEAIQQ